MSQETRLERDSLGKVYVPVNALYGAQTQRAVENFPISGLRPWRAFIWSLATIKLGAILLFLLITSPTSSYALAHAALLAGIKPDAGTAADEEDHA